MQNLINLRKKFETNGEYDPSKAVTVTGDLQYRLGDLEAWAKEGCSYQAAGYLSLVEETYPAVNGGGYIERYLNGEISTQEATNISNAIENMMFSITKDIDTYKRLINKYDAGKSNVAYYYRSINGAVYTNLKLEEGGKEEARQKIEDLGQYLCYDDEDIHFDTNINNLEEYFYQDETYITGNMDTDAVFMMGVNAKLPYKDHFYKAKESYNRLHPWIKISIITTFVSIIGWIAALVYLSTVTGRKSHEDEVHLNGFDKIKTEIVIVAGNSADQCRKHDDRQTARPFMGDFGTSDHGRNLSVFRKCLLFTVLSEYDPQTPRRNTLE